MTGTDSETSHAIDGKSNSRSSSLFRKRSKAAAFFCQLSSWPRHVPKRFALFLTLCAISGIASWASCKAAADVVVVQETRSTSCADRSSPSCGTLMLVRSGTKQRSIPESNFTLNVSNTTRGGGLANTDTGTTVTTTISINESAWSRTTQPQSSPDLLLPFYLPLLPWEQASAEWDRTCRPPAAPTSATTSTHLVRVPEYCCIGAAAGAGLVSFEKKGCNKGPDVYRRNEELALKLYNDSLLQEPMSNYDKSVSSVSTSTSSSSSTPYVPCDLCRIVDILFEHNWTMALLGDSITRQSFFALECELRRRKYHVHRTTDWYDINATHYHYDEYHLEAVHELHITKPDSKSGSASTSTSSSGSATAIVIRLFATYRPPMRYLMKYVANSDRYHNDVLIFDHGTHYGYQPDDLTLMRNELTQLLQTLLFQSSTAAATASSDATTGSTGTASPISPERRPWKLLAWRETSAQHFDRPGGDYAHNLKECVPMNSNYANRTDEEKYGPRLRRRAIMESVLQSLNVSNNDVAILDFWNYTSHFHDLHAPGDCTHFCSTPSFWLYLWHQIRSALDQRVPLPTALSHE